MTTADHRNDPTTGTPYRSGNRAVGDETKPSFKTTEMMAYVASVIAIIVTCIAVDGDDGSADPFNANDALKYITWATIGYMIARGLAKSGRRWPGDNH